MLMNDYVNSKAAAETTDISQIEGHRKKINEKKAAIEKALAKRNKARSKKMWSVADDIRNMLKEMGVLIQDTGPNTSEWRWAKGALQDSEAEEDGSAAWSRATVSLTPSWTRRGSVSS